MKHILFFLLFFSNTFLETSNFDKAEKLYQEGKYVQAKSIFEICLKENPNDYKTIEYLGDIAGHLQDWNEAILKYQLLKNKFPQNANYWYKYGGATGMKAKSVNKFKAVGMISTIENAFLTAAKLDTKHIETRWALVMLYIELPGIVGGSEKKAQKYSDELMNLSKVDGYLSKGYIDEYFNRNSSAETNYIKAYQIGKSKTTFQKLYNLYLNKIKDPTKAKKLKEQFEK